MQTEISPIRKAIQSLDGEFLLLEPAAMDNAIVGLVSGCGTDPVVCYDRKKVIEILMSEGLIEDEAEEFFEFNILGAYMGNSTPMFITLAESLVSTAIEN